MGRDYGGARGLSRRKTTSGWLDRRISPGVNRVTLALAGHIPKGGLPMSAAWFVLFLATLWLAMFGADPGRAVTLPLQVGISPPV